MSSEQVAAAAETEGAPRRRGRPAVVGRCATSGILVGCRHRRSTSWRSCSCRRSRAAASRATPAPSRSASSTARSSSRRPTSSIDLDPGNPMPHGLGRGHLPPEHHLDHRDDVDRHGDPHRPGLRGHPRHAAASRGALQNLFEFAYEIARELRRRARRRATARPYIPLFAVFFVLILFCNWSGLIPPIGKIERAPGADVATSTSRSAWPWSRSSSSSSRASGGSASAATSASSSRSTSSATASAPGSSPCSSA